MGAVLSKSSSLLFKLFCLKKVKAYSLFSALICGFVLHSSYAADTITDPKGEDLPEIEARHYEIIIVRSSASGRVYLLEDKSNAKPRVGKVILLKRDILSPPSMAMRIIRMYPGKNQFAAKRVKRYGDVDQLQQGTVLLAIEKIADLKPYQTVEEEELKDEAELDEIEKVETKTPEQKVVAEKLDKAPPKNQAFSSTLPSTKKFDSVLDAEAKGDLHDPKDDETESPEQSIIAKSDHDLDPNRNLLGADVSAIRNVAPGGGTSTYFTGVAFRYGYTLLNKPFFMSATLQDSITIETILFYYRVLNYTGVLDSYNVTSPCLILRENFHTSDTFTFFIYAGGIYNYIFSSFNQQSSSLQNFGIAGGVGFLYRMGPRWDLRMNFGYESLSGGIALRF